MSLSNLQNNVNRENELWAFHLSISVLDQPMVKLDSLDEVLNRDPLVEPMEPFCVIFGYEGWGEPGKKLVAEDESLQPVYLVNQILVVLGVCIGN